MGTLGKGMVAHNGPVKGQQVFLVLKGLIYTVSLLDGPVRLHLMVLKRGEIVPGVATLSLGV